MSDRAYAVIMAGGGGTRLWPLSRQDNPKQFLRLTGDRTLFQMAIDRLEGLFPPERILIVTVQDQAQRLQQDCPSIPAENYLIEPMPRGTASVVGLGAVAIQQRDPQATMVILTADHFIRNVGYFQDLLRAAIQVAERGNLVTLGITPTYPATGYGYIQQGDGIGTFGNFPAFSVVRFTEKPDEPTAMAFLHDGGYHWNSGMFVWKVSRILEEFEFLMPDLAVVLHSLREVWADASLRREKLLSMWKTIVPQTIDYGIMEKARQVAVVPAGELGWSDIGSWDSLFEVFQVDGAGNIILKARHIGVETHGSLIYGDELERMIVTIGLKDVVVVDTADALLVCPRNQVQKLRQVVNTIKNSHSNFA